MTATLVDFTDPSHAHARGVVQLNSEGAEKMRAISRAIWEIGIANNLSDGSCARLAREAKRLFRSGQATPAEAVAQAAVAARRGGQGALESVMGSTSQCTSPLGAGCDGRAGSIPPNSRR